MLGSGARGAIPPGVSWRAWGAIARSGRGTNPRKEYAAAHSMTGNLRFSEWILTGRIPAGYHTYQKLVES